MDVVHLDKHQVRHGADAGSTSQCSKGFFSQSQLSVQTLPVFIWSSGVHMTPLCCVQLHALINVHAHLETQALAMAVVPLVGCTEM